MERLGFQFLIGRLATTEVVMSLSDLEMFQFLIGRLATCVHVNLSGSR